MRLKRTAPARLAAIFASAVLAAGVASAQGIGEQEYMNSCAQCHGADGMGDGVLAGYLNTAVPDLTQLQKNNGGVFPFAAVYETIRGEGAAGAHGTRDMPAWGNRYRIRGAAGANPDALTDEAGVFARARILALAEYLSTIQAE